MQICSKVGKNTCRHQESRRESGATNTSLFFLHDPFFIIFFPATPWLSRAVSTSVRKHGEILSDTLKLLGYRNKEEGWKVYAGVTIQNARNGLVSFELNEHLER